MAKKTQLKHWTEYSELQQRELESVSSAVHRYMQMIHRFGDRDDFKTQIRVQRHNAWLSAAFASHFNTHSIKDICSSWSWEATEILTRCWDEADLAKEDLVLCALGKLGAEELNLSSDVDLVIVSRNSQDISIQKKIKLFTKLLTENLDAGWCLRVDYNLRPGGRFGPIVSSLSQFQDYYWSQGETWERMAFVRFRVLCGPLKLSDDLLQIINKYTYRRFLDYTLFDDLKTLRTKIQWHYGEKPDGFDLKLGIGGIRDIELFLHALMIIHGGKQKELRHHRTDVIATRLLDAKVLNETEYKLLVNTYWHYRRLENLVQLEKDDQTHLLKYHSSYPTFDRKIDLDLPQHQIDVVVSTLLGKAEVNTKLLPETSDQQKEWLEHLGFESKTIESVWPELVRYTALSKRKQKDEIIRKNFLFLFIEELVKNDMDKDLGLSLLLDFIKATRAKASFYSLLVRETPLLHQLARLFSTSPYLGGMLSSRPELLDGFLFRRQEDLVEDFDMLLEKLSERRLLTELIACNEFLIDLDTDKLVNNLSHTADEICQQLLDRLKEQIQPDSKIQILALGKWGGLELGLKSDLDFIFVTPEPPTLEEYKIAKRFISRLNDQHKGGKIYSMDLRLRPSGNAGPLIVSSEQLENFLKLEAPAWIRQSYLRARFLQKSLFEITPLCFFNPLKDEDLLELKRIRLELKNINRSPDWNLKFQDGGLIDIEFAVQTSILAHQFNVTATNTCEMIQHVGTLDENWKAHAKSLLKHYQRLRQIEQLNQLVSAQSGSFLDFNSHHYQRLCRLLDQNPTGLKEELDHLFVAVTKSLAMIDPILRH